MSITKKYGVADENNGVFQKFEGIEEAKVALAEAIEEGTKINFHDLDGTFDNDGNDLTITMSEAREMAEKFYFLVEITENFDEDGELIDTEENVI